MPCMLDKNKCVWRDFAIVIVLQ